MPVCWHTFERTWNHVYVCFDSHRRQIPAPKMQRWGHEIPTTHSGCWTCLKPSKQHVSAGFWNTAKEIWLNFNNMSSTWQLPQRILHSNHGFWTTTKKTQMTLPAKSLQSQRWKSFKGYQNRCEEKPWVALKNFILSCFRFFGSHPPIIMVQWKWVYLQYSFHLI